MTELQRCELAKEKGFTYNPETGEIRGAKGNVIQGLGFKGYIMCQVRKEKNYGIAGHRLAWYLYYGYTPKNHIDHVNGNRVDNRIVNLRDVTNQQNTWNRLTTKGYCWDKKKRLFRSRIRINDKLIHIGYFKSEIDARKAYLEAKKIHHIIKPQP